MNFQRVPFPYRSTQHSTNHKIGALILPEMYWNEFYSFTLKVPINTAHWNVTDDDDISYYGGKMSLRKTAAFNYYTSYFCFNNQD